MKDIQLQQVSKMLAKTASIPQTPKRGWLFTLRTTLGITLADAAKKAGVSPVAWSNAEKREVEGTITLATMKKFLSALSSEFVYIPHMALSLEETIKKQALEYSKREVKQVNSTMALEDQKPSGDFSKKRIEKKADDIVRSGKWKKIWR